MTLQPASQRRVLRAPIVIAAIFLARLVVNLQFRVVYPYLPAISRGLGVPLTTGTLLITARSLAGLSSPLYGRLADRHGRRASVLAGLAAVTLGAALVGFSNGIALALAGFVILGFARACYDPAAQAFISDWVPYARRARAIGLIEMPWSASWLLGVPAAGLLIERAGWHAPFLLVAALGLFCLLWSLQLPLMPNRPATQSSAGPTTPDADNLDIAQAKNHRLAAGLLSRPVLATLGVSMLTGMASANIFLISGAWLEDHFGLAVGALGLVFGITGLAELAAELLSAGILDRVGKVRGLLIGLILNALAYLLLPLIGIALVPALVGIALVIMTSEFSIVSVLSPLTELAPTERATVLALNSALLAGGVLLASLAAPRLWAAGGLAFNAHSSAGAIALAIVLLLAFRLNRISEE